MGKGEDWFKTSEEKRHIHWLWEEPSFKNWNILLLLLLLLLLGDWGGVVVKALRYYSGGPRIDSLWCQCFFQWHISFRPYYGPRIDSAPSENEYQEYLLGVKAAGAWGWQPYYLHVPNVLEIWEPKPPGTLWATLGLLRDCFTLLYIIIIIIIIYHFYAGCLQL